MRSTSKKDPPSTHPPTPAPPTPTMQPWLTSDEGETDVAVVTLVAMLVVTTGVLATTDETAVMAEYEPDMKRVGVGLVGTAVELEATAEEVVGEEEEVER